MQNFFFNIDVLGTCNLKCPSCPVGNFKEVKNPTGFMQPDLLDKIMRKATAECNITGVGLFNWTEPLLHPQLPALVKIVQSYNITCSLSSNLNIKNNLDALMEVNPYSFRISASGFTQAVYGITHRGGDIERVKKNMIELAEAKQRAGATTRIHVLYHRYIGNLDDELLMKQFAESLEFDFQPVWAFMMPLEKILAYVNDDPTEATLTQEDLKLIERLALPVGEAVEVAQRYKSSPCILRDSQMTLDFQGKVQLCCAVYDSSKFTLAPFLSTSITDLQKFKYTHKTCTKCMDNGGHVYVVYGAPEFNNIALENVLRRYAKQLGSWIEFSPHDTVQPRKEPSVISNNLKLKEINVIGFPDWLQPEELLCSELEAVIKTVLVHPDQSRITLLLDISNIVEEDANLILSSVFMKLMMQEDLTIDDDLGIFLVGKLGEVEWEELLPKISYRIALKNENMQAITRLEAKMISTLELKG